MNSDMNHLETIFFAALNIQDPAARSDYLAQACGQDEALQKQVEQMLSLQSKVGSFMEQPPAAYAGTVNLEAKILEAGLSAGIGPGEAVVVGSANHSVLRSLGLTLSEVPRVLLRDPKDNAKDPIVRPRSKEVPADQVDSRYQLAGEIARGGMGAIIKGRDIDLGRDLAIKVLLDAHKDKPEVVQRFIEEAQIGGQLQHPGIVPVYELGQFGDQRPFFSMKLVKGETLAGLLSARKSPTEDRAKYLGIFEQICQTMAYAHSRGVIHRDLKPANIMVGAFGEVQVMDWGLAKVLAAGGIADEKKSLAKQTDVSVIQTRRSLGSESPGSIGSQTEMGSVMGTPAYMSPEQALGEVDRLDERTDVFGLAAILCEILTGKPPYVASSSEQVFRLASRGKLEDCYARLEACQVDMELKQIVLDGLALEPDDRLRDAGQLASRFSAYLESVETRLRKAEVDRATEAARAEEARGRIIEERKRRRVTMALAASLLIGLVGTMWQTYRASQSERIAIESEKEAIKARDAKVSALEKEAQQRTIAEDAQQKAQQERDSAKSAREELRKSLYAASMNLIPAAWEADNVSRVHELLNEQIPKPGEEDLRHFEWHYWYRQSHGVARNWKLGTNPENFVISEDGSTIVSSSSKEALPSVDQSKVVSTDITIRVLDVATERELNSFRIRAQDVFPKELIMETSRFGISDLFLNRNGSRIAVVIYLSNRSVSEASAELPSGFLSSGRPRFTLNRRAVVFDSQSQKAIFSKGIHSPRIAISPNGKRLFTCESGAAEASGDRNREMADRRDANGKFRIWEVDLPNKEPIDLIADERTEHDLPAIDPKFSPDGLRIVTVTRPGNAMMSTYSLRLWDTISGKEQLNHSLGDPRSSEAAGTIIETAFSPDGKVLATLGFKLPKEFGPSANAVRDARVNLWDCSKPNEIRTLQPEGGISIGNKMLPRSFGLTFSPDAERLIAWNEEENTCSLISIASGSVLQKIKTLANIRHVAFSLDGKQVITLAGDDAISRVSGIITNSIIGKWDVASSIESKSTRSMRSSNGLVVWSPTKLRQATFKSGLTRGQFPSEDSANPSVLISDANGKEVLQFKEHSYPVSLLSFSPDGQSILSFSFGSLNETETFLWEADSGKVRWSYKTEANSSPFDILGSFTALFSPDGKWLAVPADGGQRVVATTDLKEHFTVDTKHKLYFSPDGQKLVSFHKSAKPKEDSNSGQLQEFEMKIWDVESGNCLATQLLRSLEMTSQDVTAFPSRLESSYRAIFSPDSRLCTPIGDVSIGLPIDIYSLSKGEVLTRIQVTKESERSNTNRLLSNRNVVFNPAGDKLLVIDGGNQGIVGMGQSVGVWELPSGKSLYRLDGNGFSIQSAAFSPDGKRIATASTLPEKGEVKIWDAASGRELLILTSQERFRSNSISFSPDCKRLILKHTWFSRADRSMAEGEIVWDVTPHDRSSEPAQ